MRYLGLLSFSYLLLGAAWAGPHRPLCEKAAAADLILEVEFKSRGSYPERHKKRGYPPPTRTRKKTIGTGVVTAVYKGGVKIGDAVKPHWPIHLAPGGQSVRAWSRMLQRKRFRQIIFLEKKGEGYGPASWAEGRADCGSADTDHRSWCAGYDHYKQRLVGCLTALMNHRLDPSVRVRLQTFCSESGKDLSKAHYRFWFPKSGPISWIEVRDSEPLPDGVSALLPTFLVTRSRFLQAVETRSKAQGVSTWSPSKVNPPKPVSLSPDDWRPCSHDLVQGLSPDIGHEPANGDSPDGR
jgi:hypothetical protein